MRFVNRKHELAQLNAWWTGPHAGPAIVWGRRRVGKTLLVSKFGRDLPMVMYTATGQAERGELTAFSREVQRAGMSGVRDLVGRPFHDWDDALEHLATVSADSPTLLVLDEFPELLKATPHLDNLLRAFLERTKTTSRLRILLCGSAVRAMQELQAERSALYGRFTLRLHVRPFEPWEAAEMLPTVAPHDLALIYGLVGGMPLYLSWWDGDATLTENLSRLIATPSAPLLTEGELVMATELESQELPSSALHAIAAGRTRYGEIQDWMRANPTRTLDRLVSLGIIERTVPVTEKEDLTHRRVYTITDNFLAFYLRVVAQYRTEIERGLGASILPVLVESLDDFMGDRWEDIVTRHVRRLATDSVIGPDIVAVGRWWNKTSSVEIDIVALSGRDRRVSLCGEVKWRSVIDDPRILRGLQRKAAEIAGDHAVTYLLAARDRVDTDNEGVLVVTAEDVFARELRQS
jgi:AAA+ ATPase superfamily predicted ATPase